MNSIVYDPRCQRWRDRVTGRFVSKGIAQLLREVGDDELGFAAMHLGLGTRGYRYRTREEMLANRKKRRQRRRKKAA